ncbi:hypothetical protein H5410_017414 [Solanum commersonii]|uniref:Uncharacterized protein n=1 Tax=Solanum commersonii TaxID=4109 RepID=A0A9J5ZZ06_SOLCO|nr:hypothetical protein H5410_017414 [Solanum commersonii]
MKTCRDIVLYMAPISTINSAQMVIRTDPAGESISDPHYLNRKFKDILHEWVYERIQHESGAFDMVTNYICQGFDKLKMEVD